jgi:hypothetical protein
VWYASLRYIKVWSCFGSLWVFYCGCTQVLSFSLSRSRSKRYSERSTTFCVYTRAWLHKINLYTRSKILSSSESLHISWPALVLQQIPLIKVEDHHILKAIFLSTMSHNPPVTGPVARFCRQIASQGYIVAAPSSYHEFTGPEPLAYDGPGTDAGNEWKITKASTPSRSLSPSLG